MNIYRISNKNGHENVSKAMIESLKRLDMVTFKGSRVILGHVMVHEYTGRCK